MTGKANGLRALAAIALAVTAILFSQAQVHAAPRVSRIEAVFGKTRFTLNGELLERNSLLYDNAAYLPAAYIARQLGLDVYWNAAENATYLTYSYRAPEPAADGEELLPEPVVKQISAAFGSPVYYLNGTRLDRECLTYDGAAYLPASYLAQTLGLNTNWNPETNITDIGFVPVSGVSFNESEVIVARAAYVQLKPVIAPENATFKAMRYTSSDETVATVDADGTVYGKKAGSVVITCTSVNGISTRVAVRVIVPVTGIYVTPERTRYLTGEATRLQITVNPEDATDKSYTVSVDDPLIATADGDDILFHTDGRVTLSATAANGISGSASVEVIDLRKFAQEVVRLTNAEREKNRLSALSANNSRLDKCAILRAEEVIELFEHTRPNGKDCFSAFDECSVAYVYAGENIAAGQDTPEEVVKDWMNSPGHRANILKREFKEIGVGVSMDEHGRLYWTQNFTG